MAEMDALALTISVTAGVPCWLVSLAVGPEELKLRFCVDEEIISPFIPNCACYGALLIGYWLVDARKYYLQRPV